jgi:RsmE family RNA methyltransferase
LNLLLLDPAELSAGGELILPASDRRARHITGVLRAIPGESLRAGIACGATGRAEVQSIRDGQVRLRLELDRPACPRPPVDLVLAVPRPKVLSRVLQTVASFGIGRIDLVNAWRVDRSYFDSPRLRPAVLARELRLGCEQGSTTWVPEIDVHRRLMPFLDAGRGDWDSRQKLVAHPRAATLLESIQRPGAPPAALLAIGPEGGWIDREIETLARLGFAPVRIGPAVLRVEIALAAALSQLQLLSRLPGD